MSFINAHKFLKILKLCYLQVLPRKKPIFADRGVALLVLQVHIVA